MTHHDETGITLATKATPPVAVSATNMFTDFTLPDFVNYLTILYLILLAGHKAWSWHREYKGAVSDRRGKPRTKKGPHEPRE